MDARTARRRDGELPLLDTLKNRLLKYRALLRALKAPAVGKQVLKHIPPVAASPSRGSSLAFAAIVKDEAPYIAEWLEFHLMMGATKIFVYDNGSTDGTGAIVERYARTGEAMLIPWRTFLSLDRTQGSMQNIAYAHAMANFGADYRWMGFIDVDEFLFSLQDDDLVTALRHYEDLPSLTIPWHNFGPDGHETQPDGLVIENYRERAVFPPLPAQRSLLRYKTLVDPSKVSGLGRHYFPLSKGGDIAYTEKRLAVPFHSLRDLSTAVEVRLRINHYFTRSREEMRRREAKGRISRNGAVVENYLERRLQAYALATEKDTHIQRFVDPLKARLKQRWG